MNASEIISVLKSEIADFDRKTGVQEGGTVVRVGDGIATVYGMQHAMYGELVEFETGVRGIIQNLEEKTVGVVLLGSDYGIVEGTQVMRTKKRAGVGVGSGLIGRVVDALGAPIDGGAPIEPEDYYPIEREAAGVADRKSVSVPLQTGILSIDSMFPIGRGQKSSTVAKIVNTLKTHGAMDYSVVVSASASAPAPVQYIAPYSGTAMAEFFMHQGKDVLIIYDDLSKHAVAYRAMSLLLHRPPGREAYPGDVFYLHSRLLERSCRLDDAHGGGSITALPIIETQAGDISAYIPTNVISITDGQIFLESELFFAGMRPAVNVGLSVSRVGGAAQTKAMKKVAGKMRMELAQFREMEVFTQFSSDLDPATQAMLDHGHALMELLKQPLYHPQPLWRQVCVLAVASERLFDDIPLKNLRDFVNDLMAHLEQSQAALIKKIQETGQLSDEDKATLIAEAEAYKKQVK